MALRDRRERVAQLVAEHGEELVLLAVRGRERFEAGHLGLLTVRDIHDGAEDEGALIRVDRVEADLDGELAAVPAPGVEVAAGAHRRATGSAAYCGAEDGMSCPVSLGHQHLHASAEEFLATVAEEPLRLGVHQQDPPRCVDDHDRIRRSLDDQPKSPLGE